MFFNICVPLPQMWNKHTILEKIFDKERNRQTCMMVECRDGSHLTSNRIPVRFMKLRK